MLVYSSSTTATSGSELQYVIVMFILIDITQGTLFQWKAAEVPERDPPYVVWKFLNKLFLIVGLQFFNAKHLSIRLWENT
jgi:hypothetical protein